jgi:hypothetical protein
VLVWPLRVKAHQGGEGRSSDEASILQQAQTAEQQAVLLQRVLSVPGKQQTQI